MKGASRISSLSAASSSSCTESSLLDKRFFTARTLRWGIYLDSIAEEALLEVRPSGGVTEDPLMGLSVVR